MNTDNAAVIEQIGQFYLGREVNPEDASELGAPVLYDSKDLVTHGVVLGMTGSGKTGLCVAALEEAALDGVPGLIIDPKGDIANLMLSFPGLAAEEFEPWVNPDEARRKDLPLPEYARQQAELWKTGLGKWGLDSGSIQRLRAAAEVRIYTPGSTAGLPLSLLSSFTPPPAEVLQDAEALSDQIETTVSSMLALAGIQADPVRSREHILLANIFKSTWLQGRKLDLGSIIELIQNPPFARLGVIDLENFYPSKDRFELAMSFNNLLASPGFANWLAGQPLDISSLLMRADGKPQMSIFSIAHLSGTERMFFVSLLLNRVVSWMRGQSGTTSLRALVYMDEVFGYLPPTANPPSKKPLLTLLKQARAYGLGVLLASQNQVDLDYKALSNMGTWFLGRLQTARDQERLLTGLESASQDGAMDRAELKKLLSNLGKRTFLMRNVHEPVPVVFRTRWVMSYLRGPLTRNQIKTLMDPFRHELPESTQTAGAAGAGGTAGPRRTDHNSSSQVQKEVPAAAKPSTQLAGQEKTAGLWLLKQPEVDSRIDQLFAPPPEGLSGSKTAYVPTVFLEAEVRFSDRKSGAQCSRRFLRQLDQSQAEKRAEPFGEPLPEEEFATYQMQPLGDARYAPIPEKLRDRSLYSALSARYEEHLYHQERLDLLFCPLLEEYSRPGESEAEFRLRLSTETREKRDAAVQELRSDFQKKLDAAEEKILKAEERVEREKAQRGSAAVDGLMRVGTALLGAFMGRRKVGITSMRRGTSAARGAGRAWKEHQEVALAQEKVEELEEAHRQLEEELTVALRELQNQFQAANLPVEPYRVEPFKKDIGVRRAGLLWCPRALE